MLGRQGIDALGDAALRLRQTGDVSEHGPIAFRAALPPLADVLDDFMTVPLRPVSRPRPTCSMATDRCCHERRTLIHLPEVHELDDHGRANALGRAPQAAHLMVPASTVYPRVPARTAAMAALPILAASSRSTDPCN